MYCIRCGATIPNEVKYCTECGLKVPVEGPFYNKPERPYEWQYTKNSKTSIPTKAKTSYSHIARMTIGILLLIFYVLCIFSSCAALQSSEQADQEFLDRLFVGFMLSYVTVAASSMLIAANRSNTTGFVSGGLLLGVGLLYVFIKFGAFCVASIVGGLSVIAISLFNVFDKQYLS